MNARSYKKFEALVELVPPKPSQVATMVATSKNWALLHPILAKLDCDAAAMNVCRQYMHVELHREEGPRFHIMDRLYKRFSNLRREMETSAMMALLPEYETAEE
jgi:hypothetical protein